VIALQAPDPLAGLLRQICQFAELVAVLHAAPPGSGRFSQNTGSGSSTGTTSSSLTTIRSVVAAHHHEDGLVGVEVELLVRHVGREVQSFGSPSARS